MLAEKGVHRVHLLANEHDENLTVVACVDGLEPAIFLLVALSKCPLKAASSVGCSILQNLI